MQKCFVIKSYIGQNCYRIVDLFIIQQLRWKTNGKKVLFSFWKTTWYPIIESLPISNDIVYNHFVCVPMHALDSSIREKNGKILAALATTSIA